MTDIPNHLLWQWPANAQTPTQGAIIAAMLVLGSDKWTFREGGKIRYNLVRSKKVLDEAFKAIEETRTEILQAQLKLQTAELGGEPLNRLQGKFMEDYQRLFNQALEICDSHDIRPIKWSALNIGDEPGQNKIPIEVLEPLIDTFIVDDADQVPAAPVAVAA